MARAHNHEHGHDHEHHGQRPQARGGFSALKPSLNVASVPASRLRIGGPL
jgi:hypothetical protein